jgi:N-acetylglucosamine-6-phosphate deacetylase
MGMDHALRTFRRLTALPLFEAVRMASLTPARIAGCEATRGSLAVGKRADLLILGEQLDVRQVYVGGRLVTNTNKSQT